MPHGLMESTFVIDKRGRETKLHLKQINFGPGRSENAKGVNVQKLYLHLLWQMFYQKYPLQTRMKTGENAYYLLEKNKRFLYVSPHFHYYSHYIPQ